MPADPRWVAAEDFEVALAGPEPAPTGAVAELEVPSGTDVSPPVVEVDARWACAACPTNRPRLATPAAPTTATVNRARLRIFMTQPWRLAFFLSCGGTWGLL